MIVKTVVMDKIYNADGSLYFSQLDDMMYTLFQFIQDYANESLSKVIERKLLGMISRIDVVGDLRRAITFLTFVKKEMINDESNRVENDWDHYIKKYETEAYRDYLVCKGVDSEIVDGIFDIADLVYEYIPEGDTPEEDGDAGIGDMQIEGTEFPFKIY